jgi:guanylate kinase
MNTERDRKGLLIVISGPAAAGKTTIGREIAARRDRTIHIDAVARRPTSDLAAAVRLSGGTRRGGE